MRCPGADAERRGNLVHTGIARLQGAADGGFGRLVNLRSA